MAQPMPFDTLDHARDKVVVLHTRKCVYRGVLRDFDDNGNFFMESVEEDGSGVGVAIVNGIHVVMIDIANSSPVIG